MACLATNSSKLMRCLNEFKAAKYAFDLCNLLIKIQEMYERIGDETRDLGKFRSDCVEHEKYTLEYVRQIVTRGFADKTVEIIFKALRAFEKKSPVEEEQVRDLLVDSKTRKEPSEYLKQLISLLENSVEEFLKDETADSYYDEEDRTLERKLAILQAALMERPIQFITDRLLFEIFHCWCNEEFDLPFAKKKELADAVIESVWFIQERIKISTFHYNFRLGIANLQRRSALQFIKDIFVGYLSDDKKLRENIGILDKVIQFLDDDITEKIRSDEDNPDSGSECSEIEDYLETLEEYNNAGGLEVPTTHTWWAHYKKVYFP